MKGRTPAKAFIDGLPSAAARLAPKKKEKSKPENQAQPVAT
jgi:hypothetical protein